MIPSTRATAFPRLTQPKEAVQPSTLAVSPREGPARLAGRDVTVLQAQGQSQSQVGSTASEASRQRIKRPAADIAPGRNSQAHGIEAGARETKQRRVIGTRLAAHQKAVMDADLLAIHEQFKRCGHRGRDISDAERAAQVECVNMIVRLAQRTEPPCPQADLLKAALKLRDYCGAYLLSVADTLRGTIDQLSDATAEPTRPRSRRAPVRTRSRITNELNGSAQGALWTRVSKPSENTLELRRLLLDLPSRQSSCYQQRSDPQARQQAIAKLEAVHAGVMALSPRTTPKAEFEYLFRGYYFSLPAAAALGGRFAQARRDILEHARTFDVTVDSVTRAARDAEAAERRWEFEGDEPGTKAATDAASSTSSR